MLTLVKMPGELLPSSPPAVTINDIIIIIPRGRNNTRNSFRRAVDRSYHSPESREESNAIISLTKNPKKKSRNFFKTWMKSKKTSSNSSKSKKEKRRSRAVSQNFDFTPDSINELAKEFGISSDTILRMQSHSGRLEGDELNERDERRERERITREMNDHTSYNTREL
jgi:plasmid maintenance system antidote protein VapI